MSVTGSIRILGRVRPALEDEADEEDCLRVLSKKQLEVDSLEFAKGEVEPRTYLFDELFDSEATNDDIFAAIREELAAATDGEAVCILAYGATGSGKTHTVTNLAERAAKELERQAMALAQGGARLEITVQIVEIYNQQLRDLLAADGGKSADPPNLKLSVSNSGSTALLGAASRTISSETGGGIACSLQGALRMGQAQRATSATAVHGRSSRSHLVMTLFLTTRDAASGLQIRTGKFSLVDLAGSERLKRSKVVGERLKEAQHINRSLSALADVISAKERRVAHVPYRNSKLTHLLQDALGGQQRCRTVVIVALPPRRNALNDTLHTLQFSSRLTALALPTINPRRTSLRGLGTCAEPSFSSGGRRESRGEKAQTTEEERAQLKGEVSRWKSELERAQAQLEECKKMIQQKEWQLQQEEKKNAELLSSTENFERSRAQLFEGFVALHRRLEEVEASAAAAGPRRSATVSQPLRCGGATVSTVAGATSRQQHFGANASAHSSTDILPRSASLPRGLPSTSAMSSSRRQGSPGAPPSSRDAHLVWQPTTPVSGRLTQTRTEVQVFALTPRADGMSYLHATFDAEVGELAEQLQPTSPLLGTQALLECPPRTPEPDWECGLLLGGAGAGSSTIDGGLSDDDPTGSSSISVSSDEDAIRDRLCQSLHLVAGEMAVPAYEAAR